VHSIKGGAGNTARIVRPEEARDRLGLSRAKFADMLAKGKFPKPFVIVPGGRAVGWLDSDVDAWILMRSSELEVAK
jgi:prophage regulatory protein